MPLRSRLFQGLKRQADILPAGPSYRELHGHYRQSEQDQEEEINENEACTYVLSGDIWEPPYVPKSDGTACREEYETESAPQSLTLFKINTYPLYCRYKDISLSG